MNHSEICAAIANGELDQHLLSIQQACVQRLMVKIPSGGILDQEPPSPPSFGHIKPALFRVGDKAKFNGLVSPRYLIGMTGRISKLNRTTARFIFDKPAEAGRFGRSPRGIRVSFELLTKI